MPLFGAHVNKIVDTMNTRMEPRNSQPNIFLFFFSLDALDLVSIALSFAPLEFLSGDGNESAEENGYVTTSGER
jgi:hypothetical protein